jgi:uncharacterized protein
MKLLLILLLLLVLYLLLRKRSVRPVEPPGPPAAPVERMVTCARCGVHLPRSDSLAADGLYFCSPEHRNLGRCDNARP